MDGTISIKINLTKFALTFKQTKNKLFLYPLGHMVEGVDTFFLYITSDYVNLPLIGPLI